MATPAMVLSIKFTAQDSMFSAAIERMSMKVQAFAGKAEIAIARADRAFRKMTPAISGAAKQFLSFASAAAISTAIVGGVTFSVNALKDYETALASFRTIVSDASNNEFKQYQNAVKSIATETKSSAIDVAKSFENIAGLNAKFAETAQGLGKVSKAAITLSTASGDSLDTAAANLVGIMNQFNLAADQADRTINVLAAGQAVGAANISQSSEAYKNFGSVASAANITLEQSQALIQTLASKSLFGAEAGTKLRGSVLKLQQAGLGYKSGQFQINDALDDARQKMDKLKTAKQKDAFLNKTFGAENITTGLILLNNIELYKEMVAGVTGTSEAQKAAAINSDTLSFSLHELKNSWINMVTGSDSATGSLNLAKNAVKFLTDNLGTIVSVGTKVLLFFAAWKAAIIIGRAALLVYNIQLGIMGALTGKANIAIGKSIVALRAYKIALALSHPIGLLSIALIGLAGAFYASTRASSKSEIQDKITADIKARAAEKTIDQRVELDKLFNTLKTQIAGSEKYNAALQELEKLQPGIIERYGLERGEVISLTRAHEELIKTIEKRAQAEAAMEIYKEAVKERLQLEMDYEKKKNQGALGQLIQGFHDFENTRSQLLMRREAARRNEQEAFRQAMSLDANAANSDAPTPFLSTSQAGQEAILQHMERVNNASVTLNVNDPNNRVSAESDSDMVRINTSSTFAFGGLMKA